MKGSGYLRWFRRLLILGAGEMGPVPFADAAVPKPLDVADAARTGGTGLSTHSPVSWGEWAIGIGVGAGLAVPFGAALLMDRRRHDVRTA